MPRCRNYNKFIMFGNRDTFCKECNSIIQKAKKGKDKDFSFALHLINSDRYEEAFKILSSLDEEGNR